mgnify:FL=1
MSDDADDVEDITSICGGLNINIGTLNKNTIPSMFLAGKKANELGHIVLLDPVGAGASRLRTDTANRLMQEVRFDAVRGNISEIKTLCTGSGSTKGVDADAVDAVTEANLDDGVQLVKTYYCDNFEEVVAACPVPIVVAGGKKLPEDEALTMAYRAISDGARGVDMGRNIFQSNHPVEMAKAIRMIVHHKATDKEAFEFYTDAIHTK